MRELTRRDIIDAFPRKHRKKIVLPASLEAMRWHDLEFLGWFDVRVARGFIVMEHRGTVRGLLLTRSTASAASNRRVRMCNLCKTVHGNQGVRLFIAEDTRNPNRKIGNDFCDDLQCSLRVHKLIPLPPNQMAETLGVEERAVRLLEEAERFFDQCYGS